MTDDKFCTARVLWVKHWSDNLLSFAITRPQDYRFSAGQFARIGLEIDGKLVMRAYSIVSSPYDDALEFFSIVVPDGALTPQLQHIQVGDAIWLEKTVYGFLTLARFQQPLPQDLWLLATGTGVAPFLSILQDFSVWQQYQKIVLAYSVRTSQELAYVDQIRMLQTNFGQSVDGKPSAELIFLPIVTREPTARIHQRLPQLIANGELERFAGINFQAASSHIMLCGNPQMIEDTKNALKARGLSMNRRGEGNIAVENYW